MEPAYPGKILWNVNLRAQHTCPEMMLRVEQGKEGHLTGAATDALSRWECCMLSR